MKIGDPSQLFLEPLAKPINQSAATPATGFGSILKEAVGQVNRMQGAADEKMTSEMIGGQDDLHEVMLSMEKAGLALKLLVQGRDRLIKAYEEIKNMQM